MKTFRDLNVWRDAHVLTLAIYQATAVFPSHEQYGLVNQMRRAAVSVAANIVEGHKRRGHKEFLNFLTISDSSLEELKYYLLLAHDLHYLTSTDTPRLYGQTESVGRMLTALKHHIRQEVSNGRTPSVVRANL